MSEIKFDISMDPDNINLPSKVIHEESTSFIDEEGLLPGTSESRETSGFLALSYGQTQPSVIQFAPIADQQALVNMALTSKGANLHYELMHNNQLLVATQGETDNAVFTVHLDKNGSYTFTLHNHLDRTSPPNLVASTEPSQNIHTQPGELYQLTFYHQGHTSAQNEANDVQIYWGDNLIYTLPSTKSEGKGYTFSVEGVAGADTTKLQFVSTGNEHAIKDTIHDVSVMSTAQNKVPIDFAYVVADMQGNETHGQFTVNITTTPPIQVSNHEPFDVIFEHGVYQTIIVSDGNAQHNPLTTINLDNLFNHLAISAENRVVEVVQREENGFATNVYEVKISDKSQSLVPITVADVQLSFPGGDGGLHVFQRNIFIEEGGSNLMPPLGLGHDHLA
ncbi:MAG: hypothetical protein HYX61_00630 [Gammaproteobacteria bacterium]|jgi:hypothetical protein|nr:hypothetical protein [Gammaproteobacteria bacterium]